MATGDFGLRSVTSLALPLVLSFASALAVSAQGSPEATPAADEAAETLFALSFESSTLEPAEDGAYTLTLTNGGDQAVFFGNQPSRVVGTVPTADLLTEISAADSPINAAIVELTDDATEEVVVVELLSGEIDEAAGTVTVTVTVLGAATDFEYELESEPVTDFADGRQYGTTQVFVDDWCYLFFPPIFVPCGDGSGAQGLAQSR